MRNKFLNLSAVTIVVVALFSLSIFVACTNEDDYQNDNYIKNKSSIGNGLSNEYIPKGVHQYEQNNYSEDQIISIMSNFTELINHDEIGEETYDINKAVFAMETFFNIAIVDKQNDFEETSYNSQKFNCVIELNQNGEIESAVLRDKYISFLNTVMSSMGNKFLQYSNIYVEDLTSSSITFALEMPPLLDNDYFFPRKNRVVRDTSELYTDPINDTDDWNNYYTGSVDEVVRLHSKKIIFSGCFLNIQVYNTTGSFASTPWINHGTSMSPVTGQGLSDIVNDCIINANHHANNINIYDPVSWPRTMIDVIPVCEVEWNENKQYMKRLCIRELHFAYVPTVKLGNILYDMVVINNDIFEF